MSRSVLFLAAIALLAAPSCTGPQAMPDTAGDPVTVTARVADTFALQPGQRAAIPEDETFVRLDAVTEDSRCPTGVECAWEGEAVVQVTVFYGDGTVHEAELRLPGGEPGRVADERAGRAMAAGYVIHLLEVSPYPDARTTPDRGGATPTATLRLERLHR